MKTAINFTSDTRICGFDAATELVKTRDLEMFKAGALWAAKIDQHHHNPMQDFPLIAPSAWQIHIEVSHLTEIPK